MKESVNKATGAEGAPRTNRLVTAWRAARLVVHKRVSQGMEARRVAEGMRLFEGARGSAQGLNRGLLNTITAVAEAGMPGYDQGEIMRISKRPGVKTEDRDRPRKIGTLSYNWDFRFGGEAATGRESDHAIHLLTEDGRAPTMTVKSDDLPGGSRSVAIQSMTIIHRLPVDMVGYGRASAAEGFSPGETWLLINQVSDTEREHREGRAAQIAHENPGANFTNFADNGLKIKIGNDGRVQGVELGQMVGGYSPLRTFEVSEVGGQVSQLFGQVANAANFMGAAGRIPDDPGELFRQ